MRAAFVVLVLLGFPGCLFGHCGPSSSAAWVEPELFGEVQSLRGSAEVRQEPAPPGVPFANAEVEA